VVAFAISVALTLHAYLAARVLWLLFPLFLLLLALARRPLWRDWWRPTLAGLLLAAALTTPMFLYLRAHPEAETRLQMLDRSLDALRQANLAPLARNAGAGLAAFFWPGAGDHFLAYNIPGRPIYDGPTAIFALLGLVTCLVRWRHPPYLFALLWLIIGILPSLVTGPEANTTRNLGALPAAYMLPALGLTAALGRAHLRGSWRRWTWVAASLWLILATFLATRDYFAVWSQRPDVRAAYQRTLTEALTYWRRQPDKEPTIISTLYPGPAHDPSIGRVWLGHEEPDLRWVDARAALLFPAGQGARLLLPASTRPLHPALGHAGPPLERVSLRPDDLDPYFELYQVEPPVVASATEPILFGQALALIEARWLADPVVAGETAELRTIWRVLDPAAAGPITPPAYTTDVVFFAHLLNDQGAIVAQRDALDAPSWGWQAGDLLVQLQPLSIGADSVGLFVSALGVYDRQSGERLPVFAANGDTIGTVAAGPNLRVVASTAEQ
jgi:hypothetical protein